MHGPRDPRVKTGLPFPNIQVGQWRMESGYREACGQHRHAERNSLQGAAVREEGTTRNTRLKGRQVPAAIMITIY